MTSQKPVLSTDELDTFASIYERDVDITLVQSIRSCPAIRNWLLTQAGLPAADLFRVRHSLSTSDKRETDLEVRFGDAKAAYVLQIENKLDAEFQPDQQASYVARTESLAEESDVVAARCILICPERYAQSADGSAFDAILTYEAARDILLAEGAWGRSAALVIQHAIDKHRRGGTDSPIDESRTKFFRSFSELAHQHGLPLIPHRPRKRNAGFLWWPRAGTLRQPKGWNPSGSHGASLSAKLIHGFADIELTGVGSVCDIRKLAKELDENDVVHDRNGGHLRIRKDAPQLDPSSEFDTQRDAANTFVRSLAEQHRWWHDVGCDLVAKRIHMERN